MFTKRKGIVIGETYLFDVLNETNMASAVSLVTVVKKTGFRKYTVISVNNGYVFETKAKYLTPYTDPEKASVIRCQYGTTEFDDADMIRLALVRNLLGVCSKYFNNDPDNNELVEAINDARGIVEFLETKIQQYVNISNYKDIIKIMSQFNNEYKNIVSESDSLQSLLNKSDKDEDEIKLNRILDESGFKEYFDNIVDDYLNNNMDFESFISQAKDIIYDKYPIELLENCDKNPFVNTNIDSILADIVGQSYKNNSIAFVITVDKNNKIGVEEFYHEEDSDFMDIFNSLRKYIHNIYPKLDMDELFVPEYRFNVISVKIMEEEYENE